MENLSDLRHEIEDLKIKIESMDEDLKMAFQLLSVNDEISDKLLFAIEKNEISIKRLYDILYKTLLKNKDKKLPTRNEIANNLNNSSIKDLVNYSDNIDNRWDNLSEKPSTRKEIGNDLYKNLTDEELLKYSDEMDEVYDEFRKTLPQNKEKDDYSYM